MKDSSLIGFRIILLAAFVGIVFLFFYFVYPSIKATNDALRMENLALQNEKLEIERIVLEEDIARSELETLRENLRGIQYARDISEHDFENNIRAMLRESGLDTEVKEIEIGDLQKKANRENIDINLKLVPIKVNITGSESQIDKAVKSLSAGKAGLYIINEVSSEDSYNEDIRNWTIEIHLIYYGES